MPVSVESLKLDQLSVGERLELIERIWDSLTVQVRPEDVPHWHLVELAKRRADADQIPGEGLPLGEILDEIERID